MNYKRITSIDDPLFLQMYKLMQTVFPPEEVLQYELWTEPLQDPTIYVYVALHEELVVGATEYRYYEDFNIAMTDFTIIGQPGLNIGPFLAVERMKHLEQLAAANGKVLFGMFAEIYNPYKVEDYTFGGIKPMDPYVRREVLAHLGYKRLNFPYVHPSWHNDGEAVHGLDLGFMPVDSSENKLLSSLIVAFLTRYYAVLPNKPIIWHNMISYLENESYIELAPL